MLRVITCNLNGIRSAAKKGFFSWVLAQSPDVICVQEIKAQQADLSDAHFYPEGYHGYFHFAEKPGYSGVGLYTRIKPQHIKTGLGWPDADTEGRYVEADFGKLRIASLYMPSGTSGEHRQKIKFSFLDQYEQYLNAMKKIPGEIIICGDLNMAHKNIDLKNWRSNQKNSGFLPEERAWLDKLFGEMQFVDAFRVLNQEPDQYTWWSHRGQARAKNVGWRIDYQVVTPGLKSAIQSVAIYKEQLFSDHAPLIIDYKVKMNE